MPRTHAMKSIQLPLDTILVWIEDWIRELIQKVVNIQQTHVQGETRA